MLTRVSKIIEAQSHNSALDNIFLPALAFELGGQLTYANTAARQLLEKTAKQGVALADLTYHAIFAIDESSWKNILAELFGNNQENQPVAHIYSFGDDMCFQANLHIIPAIEMPEIQCILNQVALPKQKPQNDNISEAYPTEVYEHIAAGLPEGLLLIFDKALQYTFIKESGTGIFQETDICNTEKNAAKLHDEDYVQALLSFYEEALNGKTTHAEYKTSSDKWFYFSIGPLIYSNEIKGGFVLAYNIDKYKKTELERDKKIEELWYTNNQLKIENGVRKLIERNMYEQKFELEQKNQELEQFAYVASHDLQEPLRMVSSYTQLLGNRYADKLDQEAKEFISFAVEGATRMQSLITDLLSYSRVGSREMSFEKINLDIIIQIVKRNLSVLLQETNAVIECDNYPFVQADASQLVQLFQNLISNAIKFRKSNAQPVIKIAFKSHGKFLRASVEDNGIGISMEYKDRIFQIFQRLHTRDKYPGTGIGLAICKKIVERHGGQIWVESTPGIGTKFLFTISR